jgi:hypothetical protein
VPASSEKNDSEGDGKLVLSAEDAGIAYKSIEESADPAEVFKVV